MIRADDVLALVARGSQRGEVIGRVDQVAGLAGERVAGAVRGHDRVAVGREQAAAFERRGSGANARMTPTCCCNADTFFISSGTSADGS